MKVLWMLCSVWLCSWSGVSQAVSGDEAPGPKANDCELYGVQEPSATPAPVLQFQRRVTIGLLAQSSNPTASLILQSSASGNNCSLFTLSNTISVQCGSKTFKTDVSNNFFSAGDVTDMWLDVDKGSETKTPQTWDLRVVQRRGRYKVHLLVPDTQLQPPVYLRWQMNHNLQYYFNCITGCLFQKTVHLPEGDHTFYFRHDEDFNKMTLDCSSIASDDSQRILSIDVTKDVLGPPGGLKEITVVWMPDLGSVGVLVDGVSVGDIRSESLGKDRQVTVRVSAGGGMVAACDPRFQAVAGGSSGKITSPPTVPTPASTTTTAPSTETITDSPQEHHADHWLPATFTLVFINLIVTLSAVILAAFFYFRSSNEANQFSKENEGVLATFSRRLSTSRSSTRSQHRGSQRRNKDQSEQQTPHQENTVKDTVGTSEMATTPLTSHDSQSGQAEKVISTDTLLKMDLI